MLQVISKSLLVLVIQSYFILYFNLIYYFTSISPFILISTPYFKTHFETVSTGVAVGHFINWVVCVLFLIFVLFWTADYFPLQIFGEGTVVLVSSYKMALKWIHSLNDFINCPSWRCSEEQSG